MHYGNFFECGENALFKIQLCKNPQRVEGNKINTDHYWYIMCNAA